MRYKIERKTSGDGQRNLIIVIRCNQLHNGLAAYRYFSPDNYAEIQYHYSYEADKYFTKSLYVNLIEQDEEIVLFLFTCASMVFL